jgi:hypothetical protein
MRETRRPRFGFVGWNPFQLLHSLDIARALPASMMIVEQRAAHVNEFSDELLLDSDVPVLVWPEKQMVELDGVFDVIVCQTMFGQIEHFERSKIAMLQYGQAKEPHNFGAWRSLADLCLAYGPYAEQRLSYFCPTISVGNPRFDKWGTEAFTASARARYGSGLDPTRKTILYVPTWGDLSTQEQFFDAVIDLGREHNVLVKLHHNTDLLEHHRTGDLVNRRVHHFGANDDLIELLAVSDVVLSDYSGAVFDALYCTKPVILLQQHSTERFGKKLDAHSLEYAQPERIGPVCTSPAQVAETVRRVIAGELSYRAVNEALVAELYLPSPGATERVVTALLALSRGEIPAQTQLQSYVREDIRSARQFRHPLPLVAAPPHAKAGPTKPGLVKPSASKANAAPTK